MNCGGITAANHAEILFNNSRVYFINNTGTQGGAMSLYSSSVLTKGKSSFISTVIFMHNKAHLNGGGIFVDDSGYVISGRLHESPIHTKSYVRFNFSSNIALKGGNNIYGGWVDWSVNEEKYGLWSWRVRYTVQFNSDISKMLIFDDGVPGITSDPTRVCVCVNGIPDCKITYQEKAGIYPGQTIKVDLVAVGQRFGTVEANIKVNLVHLLNSGSQNSRITEVQTIQTVQETCTTLNYAIFSSNQEERLQLKIWSSTGQRKSVFDSETLDMYPYTLGFLFQQLSIGLKLKDCPLAFSLDETEHRCVCLEQLKLLGLSYDPISYKIYRKREQWIGRAYEHQFP